MAETVPWGICAFRCLKSLSMILHFTRWDLGRPDIAMLMMVQYDGFLRPSEAVGLTVEHVVRPQGRRYPHWGLIIAPSTLKQMTKTGKTDDSILLGDQCHNKWLRECLRLWMDKVTVEVFPDITLASLESFCKSTSRQLGYQTVLSPSACDQTLCCLKLVLSQKKAITRNYETRTVGSKG